MQDGAGYRTVHSVEPTVFVSVLKEDWSVVFNLFFHIAEWKKIILYMVTRPNGWLAALVIAVDTEH